MSRKPQSKQVKKHKTYSNARRVTVMSPFAFIVIIVMVIVMLYLLIPDTMILDRWGLEIPVALTILFGLLFSMGTYYMFRDQTFRFMGANFHCPLGPDMGYVTTAPAMIEKGDGWEESFDIHAGGGFFSKPFHVNNEGTLGIITPSKSIQVKPGVGIVSNIYYRKVPFCDLPENVRNSLENSANAERIYDPEGYYLFGRIEVDPVRDIDESGQCVHPSYAFDLDRDYFNRKITKVDEDNKQLLAMNSDLIKRMRDATGGTGPYAANPERIGAGQTFDKTDNPLQEQPRSRW